MKKENNLTGTLRSPYGMNAGHSALGEMLLSKIE